MVGSYNTSYELLNKTYSGNRFVILKKFSERGSKFYKVKNYIEAESLQRILELVCSDDLQVVQTNSLETYGEYKPYEEVTDLKEFINIAMTS